MLWMNAKRVMRAGFMNFYRNGFVSLAAVLIMSVTLFAIGGVVFLSATLKGTLAAVKDKVDVNVYFQTKASEEDILALARSLRALPEVKEVQYISRGQALVDFKKRHENDELTLQALNELPENPLGAILNVRAREPSQYEGIAEFLKSDLPAPIGGQAGSALSRDNKPIIDEVNYYDNKAAIDRLTRLIDSAQTLGGGLIALLVFLSVVIAFNTIRLAMYISREEISVMRLVGASNTYIRGPFVVTGILYGIAAALLVLIAFYPLTYYLADATAHFLSGLNLFQYYLANFPLFFLIIAGSGIALGAISSFLAVRRYLHI